MMEKIKTLAIILLVIALVILGAISIAILPGCSTFKPIWIEGIPAECNMSLNVIRAYYSSAEKSGTVPAMDACLSRLKMNECHEEVFGRDDKGKLKRVEHENDKKMTYFTNCLLRK